MLYPSRKEARFECLDLCRVQWSPDPSLEPDHAECAILLEIWRFGGLFQTSVEIPQGSTVIIATAGGPVQGTVRLCEEDPFGFMVEVTVSLPRGWFPAVYKPTHLRRHRRAA
jgi:hypothetical protein